MISINPKTNNQQTIKESITLNGVGLHSGKHVELKMEPAEADNSATAWTDEQLLGAGWTQEQIDAMRNG